jgi:omega-6 fatty acid desaturase (delta-12 desaturase)
VTLSHSFVPSPIGHAGTKLALKNRKSPFLTPVSLDARDLIKVLAPYRAPSCMRSIVELVITAGPLVLLWLLMWATLDLGYWLYLLLAVPAAGFLVRFS